jgi:hypothetical protein
MKQFEFEIDSIYKVSIFCKPHLLLCAQFRGLRGESLVFRDLVWHADVILDIEDLYGPHKLLGRPSDHRYWRMCLIDRAFDLGLSDLSYNTVRGAVFSYGGAAIVRDPITESTFFVRGRGAYGSPEKATHGMIDVYADPCM